MSFMVVVPFFSPVGNGRPGPPGREIEIGYGNGRMCMSAPSDDDDGAVEIVCSTIGPLLIGTSTDEVLVLGAAEVGG